MLKKSPVKTEPSIVRRNKSGTNFRDSYGSIKSLEIENILDTKIQELNDTLKNQKEEQHLQNISNLLDNNIKKINDMLSDTIERQKELYEEREINHREKYDELLKKYNKLHILYEDQYFKFTKLLSHYQYLLFKHTFKNIDTEDSNDYQEIKKVLEYNAYNEDEKRDSLITNPITYRKYTNPIIKRSKVTPEINDSE
jgi:hypothetical protein